MRHVRNTNITMARDRMNWLYRCLTLAGVAALSACTALAPPPEAQTVYDLGGATAAERTLPAWMPANAEVGAPSWLSTTAMQYRRDYLGLASREAYAHSRWAGAPAEMLTRFLSARLAMGGAQATRCQIRMELDEFAQVFDAPASNRSDIRTRVALIAMRDGRTLSRHVIAVTIEVDGADARAGVTAHRRAAHRLADELIVWMDGLSSDHHVVDACRSMASVQR